LIQKLKRFGAAPGYFRAAGKREGDWLCHHEGTLPIECFADDEAAPLSLHRVRVASGRSST